MNIVKSFQPQHTQTHTKDQDVCFFQAVEETCFCSVTHQGSSIITVFVKNTKVLPRVLSGTTLQGHRITTAKLGKELHYVLMPKYHISIYINICYIQKTCFSNSLDECNVMQLNIKDGPLLIENRRQGLTVSAIGNVNMQFNPISITLICTLLWIQASAQ